jgi:mannose-6-phosphate isomerase class I
MSLPNPWRRTTQDLMPSRAHTPPAQGYNLYPSFAVGPGKIALGYDALVEQFSAHRRVVIDGYIGVFWAHFRRQLDAALVRRGIPVAWHDVATAMLPEDQISQIVAPFLGGDDPLFGTRYTGQLADFFNTRQLNALVPGSRTALNILYGCGAALAGWGGLLVYVDLPKNEIQFRARAGAIQNLGVEHSHHPKAIYKQFYFVDWVVLNQHQARLLHDIDLIVDEQRPDEPAMMRGDDLRVALEGMSHSCFRARPWFEPGPWGGQWIKQHVPQLPQDAPNYAWSFELITPENGLVLESDERLLEISFDFLMYYDHRAVLGDCADRFGYEFPIRFDFLDTFAGGNLSLQCHPRPDYIRQYFGERFTQDECYYILDCAPGAQVYLGFRDQIDPAEFRAAAEHSQSQASPLDVERFVNREVAHKHDLFCIPSGTIHCSGAHNLVLEISATPYIFTFKLYDWMRMDLDGEPRPLNIARAFDNLDFERTGERVREELVSKPAPIDEGPGWRRLHLPTHPELFFDVQRLEFTGQVTLETDGSCQVLSLVDGQSVTLVTANGIRQRFNYAETFVVPAAGHQYQLLNDSDLPIKVVVAYVKPNHARLERATG